MVFKIEPLDLPRPVTPQQPDFRPLSEIGDTIAAYRRKQQIADTVAGATDANGNLDVDKAGAALAQQGLLDEARPVLALAQQKAALAQSSQQHQASLAEEVRFHDLSAKQQAAALAQTAKHETAMEGIARLTAENNANKFGTIPYGGGVFNQKTGEMISAPSGEGLLDDDTVKAMAEQARAGDTSALMNLGRGAQGATNLAAVRKEIARQNAAEGKTGADQAAANAEFVGEKSGQRTIGTKQANIEMASTEFTKIAPLVVAASDAVDRTKYPAVNRIIEAWRTNTGDENVVKLGQGLNSLVNIYARAISPTGSPTVHDKVEAQNVIQAAWSKGQIKAVVDFMGQEIGAGIEAPSEVKGRMRQRFLEDKGGTASPAAPAKTPTIPKVQNADEANSLIAQARDAIAKGAPRDVVLKRLIEAGVPSAAATSATAGQ